MLGTWAPSGLQETFDFELDTADAVSFIPVYLCSRDGAIGELDGRVSFQFSPVASSMDFFQPLQITDRASGGDELDAPDTADDVNSLQNDSLGCVRILATTQLGNSQRDRWGRDPPLEALFDPIPVGDFALGGAGAVGPLGP